MFTNPVYTDSWKALQDCAIPDTRALFAQDPQRAARYFFKIKGLALDLSKNAMDERIWGHLFALAKEQKLETWRARLFAGEAVNVTERRAALHTALRRPAGDSVTVGGENIMPFVQDTLARMEKFSHAVRSGAWRGYSGKRIRHIVNIGIGGSDLGPHMVCEALARFQKKNLTVHFVSNVDAAHLSRTLAQCKPDTTLFLIASKTFTTQETMMNAQTARAWFLDNGGGEADIARHFAALSTNIEAARQFGIAAECVFPFRDWVGGRYSLWSAIGLSICLAIGFRNFKQLLRGAHAMDRHFQTAPMRRNMPILLALVGIWHRNFCRYPACAVLPYAQPLRLFPAFLQQLDMESNGKGVDRNGEPVTGYETGPVIFGEPGTNGQHAFYQLIHQGPDIIPCDFIGVKEAYENTGDHHRVLLTHMLAQAQALLQGRSLDDAGGDPHRVFSGNRPSNTLVLDRLDPYHLGTLIALYEHKIFVQGVIWNINSFDQYGVELGKELAQAIAAGHNEQTDASTQQVKAYLDL